MDTMNKEQLTTIVKEGVGKLKIPTNIQSERSKVNERLQGKDLNGFQRDALEKYLESLQ